MKNVYDRGLRSEGTPFSSLTPVFGLHISPDSKYLKCIPKLLVFARWTNTDIGQPYRRVFQDVSCLVAHSLVRGRDFCVRSDRLMHGWNMMPGSDKTPSLRSSGWHAPACMLSGFGPQTLVFLSYCLSLPQRACKLYLPAGRMLNTISVVTTMFISKSWVFQFSGLCGLSQASEKVILLLLTEVCSEWNVRYMPQTYLLPCPGQIPSSLWKWNSPKIL